MLDLIVKYEKHYALIIGLLAAILFIPGIGEAHLFDWDEINFAECAREMIMTDDYMQVNINYQLFWEKPPLFIWTQVLSMKVFGINEFAARFPNSIIGIATVLMIYYIGKELKSKLFGVVWAIIYMGSFLPNFYFKSGIIDPLFNGLIFGGIYYLYKYYESYSWKYLCFSAIGVGLAILTKGPVGLLIYGLTWITFYCWNFKKEKFPILEGMLVILISLGVSMLWFSYDLITNNGQFMIDFITYQIRLLQTQDAGHGGPFYYHFIILLIGCFPLSIFAIRNLLKVNYEERRTALFKQLMIVCFWVVLILFSIVKTKIVHYSSMCYLPLSYLAATGLYPIIMGEDNIRKYEKWLFIIIGCLLSIAIMTLPLVGMNTDLLISTTNDQFAKGNMEAIIDWNYSEMIYGIVFLTIIFFAWRTFMLDRKVEEGILIAFFGVAFCLPLTVTHFTPKIEAFSQRAAIEFYESKQEEDCYVQVYGFKSYAHLFYTKKKQPTGEITNIEPAKIGSWLLHGKIDKTSYFVTKNTSKDLTDPKYGIEKIAEKNGFRFYRRNP